MSTKKKARVLASRIRRFQEGKFVPTSPKVKRQIYAQIKAQR